MDGGWKGERVVCTGGKESMKTPSRLLLHCPACGGQIYVSLYRYATYIDIRLCKCGKRWLIKAEVLTVEGSIVMHEVSWTEKVAEKLRNYIGLNEND